MIDQFVISFRLSVIREQALTLAALIAMNTSDSYPRSSQSIDERSCKLIFPFLCFTYLRWTPPLVTGRLPVSVSRSGQRAGKRLPISYSYVTHAMEYSSIWCQVGFDDILFFSILSVRHSAHNPDARSAMSLGPLPGSTILYENRQLYRKFGSRARVVVIMSYPPSTWLLTLSDAIILPSMVHGVLKLTNVH